MPNTRRGSTMLWQSKTRLLNVLLMLPIVIGKVTYSTGCPGFCKCTFQNDTFAAECLGTASQFVTAASELPTDLQEFTFIAKPPEPNPDFREYFDLNLTQIVRFPNLTSFKIQPLSQSRYFDFSLEDIPDNWVFCQLQKLKALHLHILLYQFHNLSVACLRNLEKLDLSHTRKLSGSSVKSIVLSLTSKVLTRLLLRNVQTYENKALTRFVFLEILPPTVPFAGVLEELDFSYNSISGLGPGASFLPNLKKVDFSGNLLLGNYAIDIMSKITLGELLVWHPSLEEIQGSFQGFFDQRNSRKRSLSPEIIAMYEQNKLEVNCSFPSLITKTADWCHIQHCFVGGLSLNLSGLCGQRHQTKKVDPDCYFGRYIPLARRLKAAYLGSVTPITGGAPGVDEGKYCIDPNNQLEVLDLSNNRINEILRTPDVFNHSKVTGLLKIRELNLGNNNIYFSNLNFVDGFPTLEILRLAGNRLALNQSKEAYFHNVPKLRILDLSRNGLSDIPDKEFANLHLLETLDLSGNQLSKLEFDLSNSTLMQLLNLSNNLISSIPTWFLFSSPNVSVDLRGNPLICGCETIDFIDMVQSGILKLYKKEDLVCFHPKLGRVSIIHVDLGALKQSCSPLLRIIQYVGITLAVVFVAALLLLLWRMRWKIRYFLYRRCRSVNNYQTLIPGDDDFEWDAFVAYSSEDRNWVHYRLQEEIEDNRNHPLFLYLRTVLPDERLIERLDDTLGQCRKVIVVLSNAFLNSDHCLYDALLAQTRLQHEGRNVVVLVKLGRLPINGIPQVITRLLTTTTCLDWTEDRDGQRLFWDRLEEELMRPPRNPLRE